MAKFKLRETEEAAIEREEEQERKFEAIVEIAVRAEQVYVDVRTREAVS